MNTTEENNKLIAEFMGFKTGMTWLEDGEYETPHSQQKWVETGISCGWESVREFFPDEMKFHTSWDWLMPVVEKCFTNQQFNAGSEEDVLIMKLNDAILTVNINEVHKAVVEFIKWYNENKETEEPITINYDYSGTLVKDAQELAEECANSADTAEEAQQMFSDRCGNATGADTVIFYEEKQNQ